MSLAIGYSSLARTLGTWPHMRDYLCPHDGAKPATLDCKGVIRLSTNNRTLRTTDGEQLVIGLAHYTPSNGLAMFDVLMEPSFQALFDIPPNETPGHYGFVVAQNPYWDGSFEAQAILPTGSDACNTPGFWLETGHKHRLIDLGTRKAA